MDKDVQALVLHDEKNEKVIIELLNFKDKEEAMNAALYVVSLLNIPEGNIGVTQH